MSWGLTFLKCLKALLLSKLRSHMLLGYLQITNDGTKISTLFMFYASKTIVFMLDGQSVTYLFVLKSIEEEKELLGHENTIQLKSLKRRPWKARSPRGKRTW